jgi:hypothetical protein
MIYMIFYMIFYMIYMIHDYKKKILWLLGAQCYKLVQIADIANWGIVAKKTRKSDFVNIVVWFYSQLGSDPYFPPGANPTNYGENRKIFRFFALLARKLSFSFEPLESFSGSNETLRVLEE